LATDEIAQPLACARGSQCYLDLHMALAALLFVFFIAIVAIALAVFPPHRLVEWWGKKDQQPPK